MGVHVWSKFLARRTASDKGHFSAWLETPQVKWLVWTFGWLKMSWETMSQMSWEKISTFTLPPTISILSLTWLPASETESGRHTGSCTEDLPCSYFNSHRESLRGEGRPAAQALPLPALILLKNSITQMTACLWNQIIHTKGRAFLNQAVGVYASEAPTTVTGSLRATVLGLCSSPIVILNCLLLNSPIHFWGQLSLSFNGALSSDSLQSMLPWFHLIDASSI